MRRFSLPSVLSVVPLVLACASDAPSLDASVRADSAGDAAPDTAPDATPDVAPDLTPDVARDATPDVTDVTDVLDVADVTDAPDATTQDDVAVDAAPMDAADAVGDALVDIMFSERRDIEVPDGAVCEAVRADGGVNCREENIGPGTGLFCIRYACDVDDGGTSLDGCCRLIG